MRGSVLDSTRMFWGIPYAAAPVDDLRWRAPQEYSWEGELDATQYGPRCAQRASSVYQSQASESEDCLYMNIWTPDKPVSKKLPVMVFIHGGDHANGSSSERMPDGSTGQFYDGSKLAAKDVVVASFNYRLGALGFFPHPDLEREDGVYGNQGLLDQVAALKWIKENIDAFGGDPNNVTIFGQGSGATDVCYHMVSPLSRGLFQGAISESGGCTDHQLEEDELRDGVQKFLGKLGCEGTGESVIKCLRKLPVDDVLSAMPASAMAGDPFKPFVDGNFLKMQPRDSFDRGDIARASYILGSNSNEGSLYKATYGAVDSQAAFEQLLKQYFPAGLLEQISQTYASTQYAEAAQPYQTALSHLFGDARLVCPTFDTASRAADAGADVYVYNFDGSLDAAGSGGAHGAELGYVFGTGQSLNDVQKSLSDLVQSYWTNFAIFGDPNDKDLFEWPTYSNTKKSRVNLASNMKLLTDFRERECNLWRSISDQQFGTNLPVKK